MLLKKQLRELKHLVRGQGPRCIYQLCECPCTAAHLCCHIQLKCLLQGSHPRRLHTGLSQCAENGQGMTGKQNPKTPSGMSRAVLLKRLCRSESQSRKELARGSRSTQFPSVASIRRSNISSKWLLSLCTAKAAERKQRNLQ